MRRAEFVLKVSVFLQGVRRINNYIIPHKIKKLTVALFKIVGREEIYRKHFIMCFMF